jgi:(heptosyl)LPS beta-1,4-glucosyltransferase
LKLSSIIIAKDEEKNISRCIQSQLGCIDEIVVLIDDRTEDSTPEIVKSFPQVKYVMVQWKGFSETKKYAVSLTFNKWILWIDADEALTKNLSDEINEFKNKEPMYDAYSFPRKANFLGKWIMHSGWYPARVTRLFNKEKVSFNDREVHEHLIITGEVGKFRNDIEHYTDPDIRHYFEKFNNYTTLAADELNLKGKAFKLSDLILRPLAIFIKMFLIKRGFLDGTEGFILAAFSSAYVFTKYCKLWERKIKD